MHRSSRPLTHTCTLLSAILALHCGDDDRRDGGSFIPVNDSGIDTGVTQLDSGHPDATPDATTTDLGLPDSGEPDLGVPDAGFPDADLPDADQPDLAFPDADLPDADPTDLAFPDADFPDADPTDLAFPDADFPDADPTDLAFPDADPIDMGVSDSGVSDSGTMDAGFDDAAVDAGVDVGVDAGPQTQTGDLIISEINVLGTEWIEIYNASSNSIDLTSSTLDIQSSGSQPIRAPTDPTGGSGTPVAVAPGAYALGYPNPLSSVPNDATFLFGARGALSDAFGDTGDVVTLQGSSLHDTVSFLSAVTDPATPLTPADYPIYTAAATQLSSMAMSEILNDSGSNWCVPHFRGSTPGAANHDCTAFVLSEVLYDYDSLSSGIDDGYEFVEIAGAGGGSLADVLVTRVEGSGSTMGNVDGTFILSSLRMPLDGLYVLADEDNLGATNVANADEIVALDLENSNEAVQLIHHPSSGPPILLDVFAYGNVTQGTLDSTRTLPITEGAPVTDLSTRVHPAVWTRSDDEADTDDNTTDFRHDPTTTPGERNGADQFGVTSIDPDNALATLTATVVIVGNDFTDFMSVTIGTETASCLFLDPNSVECLLNYPAAGSGLAEQVDVTVATRPEHGGTITLTDGFTWTTANNETDTVEECDWCILQHPPMTTTSAGVATEQIFGRIFEGGLTDVTSGEVSSIIAEVGYGPVGTDPTLSNDWVWFPAVFNQEYGNNDEYEATLTVSTAGSYLYTYRFSLDGGLTYSYTDNNGAGSNSGLGFNPANIGQLTVQ